MRPLLAPLLCAALLVPACARDSGSGDGLDVVSAAFPLTWLIQRVGDDHVRVTEATPPGAEPHDVELSPAQVGQVEQADLVVLVKGFQPALDDAAPDDKTFDLLTAAGGTDPHVWHDPVLLSRVARRLAQRFAVLDPDNAGDYGKNAAQVERELLILHAATAKTFAKCARKDLVTSHAAFGRFAERYKLRATAIANDPEAEPTPKRLSDVVAIVQKNGVTTVFAESADSKPAQTVAREAKVTVEVLDPIEVSGPIEPPKVFGINVAKVAKALGCG